MDIESPSGSAERFKLYDELELQEFQDKFVIKSHESPNQGFWISRVDGNINPIDDDTISETPSMTSTIYGVVGTIRLVVGTYAIVITSRKEVGSFLGFPVYRLTSMRVLACNEALRFSTSQEKKDEAYFLTLLKIVESMPGLYYSYEIDITLNLQRRSKLVEGWMSKPLWKQADPRYVWNKHLMEELIEFKLDRFILPLVQGSFQTDELKLKDSCAKLTLISRRCTRRLGTRMWRRGANFEGDTANFIETEQLLEIEDFRFSFLQVRGSIPLLWEQIVDLSYKPSLRVISHEQTHGVEGQLSAAYAAEMQNQQSVRYVPFDFHLHCGSSNFDNLKILYDQISEDFEKQRYFLIDSKGDILEEQKGIIRSNCIDSLDRTNVTQCYMAQKSINLQLHRIGVLTDSECISMFEEEYGKFRILWAEQGDEISLEYAGTNALKGDLVRYEFFGNESCVCMFPYFDTGKFLYLWCRYGKKTLAGLIKDGISALSRYYLNNFHDGIRQDALDLISGHYTVSRNIPSPFQRNSFEPLSKTVNMQYLPVASALIIGGLTATTFTLQQAGRNAQHCVSSVLCAGITAGVMAIVKANGRQFCSRPRLCGLL
uniref:Phosphoinositide phosphatase SAC8 isoform X3 n=1 Tax=Cicer arietinum TaxID=3827 RepID=A0A3Q7XIK8_CICAR|nr:phosphoinositide phosphatase SAC8 isoform X3 [Cicer arietinum]